MKKDRNCGMPGPTPYPYPPYGGGYPTPMPAPAPGYPGGYPNMNQNTGVGNSVQEQLNNMQGQINMLDKRLTNLEGAMMSPKEGYGNNYNNANYHIM